MRKILVSFLTLIILVFSIPATYVISQSQNIQIEEKTIIYNLPYPGILSDHPFYFLKSFRDTLLILITREPQKKTQLLLHLSDKHVAMASALLEKGKEEKALSSIYESQELFQRIFPLMKNAKEQGLAQSSEFVETLLQSNTKHKEVITELLEGVSESNVSTLKDALEINKTLLNEIEKL